MTRYVPYAVLMLVVGTVIWVSVGAINRAASKRFVSIGVTQDPLSCEVVAARVSLYNLSFKTPRRLPDRTIVFDKKEVRRTVLTLRAENRSLPVPVEVMVYCDQTTWESGTDHSTSSNVVSIDWAGSPRLTRPISTGEATEIKLEVFSDAEVKAPWFKCFCSFRAYRNTAAGRIGL